MTYSSHESIKETIYKPFQKKKIMSLQHQAALRAAQTHPSQLNV
jgi:hypothetical protein